MGGVRWLLRSEWLCFCAVHEVRVAVLLRWDRRWENVGEGLQEVAVTEEVGRRSRVRAFRFPRARAKGSCCVGLPLGVWIELGPMPERAVTIEKSNENQRFFNIFSLKAQAGPKSTPGRPKVGPQSA